MIVNPVLTISQLENEQWWLWRVEHPMVWLVEGGTEITTPAGFVSDGPTIPRFLWAVLPVWGRWGRAGVMHDYL